MILGINWGRLSINGEFGAGISERRMASAEASSTKRVKRVKTLLTRKTTMRKLISRKTIKPRRMLGLACEQLGVGAVDDIEAAGSTVCSKVGIRNRY